MTEKYGKPTRRPTGKGKGCFRHRKSAPDFPDIDLFFSCSDTMAQGASAAVRRAGRKMFTIGLDGNPDAVEDVARGNLTATLAVYPKEMGETAVKATKESEIKASGVLGACVTWRSAYSVVRPGMLIPGHRSE